MESNQSILVDLINDVVDSMRATGTIDSFTYSVGKYSIISTNELSDFDSVKINDVDYLISDVSELGFTIEAVEGLDFDGVEWKALAPYYEFGHMLEIADTLTKKNNGDYAFRKYPLIILFQPYTIKKNNSNSAFIGEANANIAIANVTDKLIKSKDRYDLNFRDVLYPLYDSFMEALVDSNVFATTESPSQINHDVIEQPYWGSSLTNSSNIMTDFIDAIELQNTELNILNGINC